MNAWSAPCGEMRTLGSVGRYARRVAGQDLERECLAGTALSVSQGLPGHAFAVGRTRRSDGRLI